MFGAIVQITSTMENGFLTTDHSASSYGLPVFVPLDENYIPTGEPARGSGEVGNLISCGYVGELPSKAGERLPFWAHQSWTTEFTDAVRSAGFTVKPEKFHLQE